MIRFQEKNNSESGERLINLIEKYKESKHSYPNSLTEIKEEFRSDIPKIWSGLIASDYLYYHDKNNGSFSLTMKFGEHGGKTWQSSIGSWDYFGD